MSLSFLEWAWTKFEDQQFGVSGYTIKSFERNVLDQLKNVAWGRGYTYTHQRAQNRIIFKRNGNTVTLYVFGGQDESSYKLVQGKTLAGFYFDEVVLQPKSFVLQAMGRCSIKGRKWWYNCNPEGPYHWVKTELIDKVDKLNLFHIHTTLEDNLSLDQEIIDGYKAAYSGVFYQRYILGLWVMAEGVIYDMFDANIHVRKAADKYRHYGCAIDYGTNNACVFGKFGWDTAEDVQLCKEYYYSAKTTIKDGQPPRQKTDSEYAKDLIEFLDGDKAMEVIVDPSALSFKTELRRQGFTNVRDAKNSVIDGIRFQASMLHNEYYHIDPSCKETEKEYSAYLWDEKAQQRGEDKPIKEYDHCKDMERYFLFTKFGRGSSGGSQEFRV